MTSTWGPPTPKDDRGVQWTEEDYPDTDRAEPTSPLEWLVAVLLTFIVGFALGYAIYLVTR